MSAGYYRRCEWCGARCQGVVCARECKLPMLPDAPPVPVASVPKPPPPPPPPPVVVPPEEPKAKAPRRAPPKRDPQSETRKRNRGRPTRPMGETLAVILRCLPATTAQLAEVCGIRPNAVNRAIGNLRAAGMIRTRRKGRTPTYYAVNADTPAAHAVVLAAVNDCPGMLAREIARLLTMPTTTVRLVLNKFAALGTVRSVRTERGYEWYTR